MQSTVLVLTLFYSKSRTLYTYGQKGESKKQGVYRVQVNHSRKVLYSSKCFVKLDSGLTEIATTSLQTVKTSTILYL